MYLKDAAKAGRELHFKHAIVYLDKALNKIEQQRPQLKHNVMLQQAIDAGIRSVTIRVFCIHAVYQILSSSARKSGRTYAISQKSSLWLTPS